MSLSIAPNIVWGSLFLVAVVALVLTGLGWKRIGDVPKPDPKRKLTHREKEQIEHLRLLNEKEKQ